MRLSLMKLHDPFLATSLIIALFFSMFGCAATYQNRNPIGEKFPSVIGTSLQDVSYAIPENFSGRPVLLLLGYLQNTQFDIDRWLIGLDQTNTAVNVYELPTIQGWFPRLFQRRIDNFMRSGIPNELWGGIVTIYKDGERIQKFTGNVNPINARVILVDKDGRIIFFYDRGFSVDALNKLRKVLRSQNPRS